jgi:hypothetical protein
MASPTYISKVCSYILKIRHKLQQGLIFKEIQSTTTDVSRRAMPAVLIIYANKKIASEENEQSNQYVTAVTQEYRLCTA